MYNLCSERSYNPNHFKNATASFPFDDHNPCPFHLLIKFCEDAENYLAQNEQNVIAVHCKAGKGRTGLVLSAYLQFSKFKPTSQEALDYYASARTKNGKVQNYDSCISKILEYLQDVNHDADMSILFLTWSTCLLKSSILDHAFPRKRFPYIMTYTGRHYSQSDSLGSPLWHLPRKIQVLC